MKLDEQETVVVWGRTDEVVRIYSTVPAHIRKIAGNQFTTVVKNDGESIEAVVPKEHFNPMRGFKPKKREMTPEQREAATRRLREARERKAEA